MIMKDIKELKQRIIARGEFSDHCHVVVGGHAEVKPDGTLVWIGADAIKHVKESAWLQGQEVWTQEHDDVPLHAGAVDICKNLGTSAPTKEARESLKKQLGPMPPREVVMIQQHVWHPYDDVIVIEGD